MQALCYGDAAMIRHIFQFLDPTTLELRVRATCTLFNNIVLDTARLFKSKSFFGYSKSKYSHIMSMPAFSKHLNHLSLHSCDYYIYSILQKFSNTLQQLDMSLTKQVHVQKIFALNFGKLKSLALDMDIGLLNEEFNDMVLNRAPLLEALDIVYRPYFFLKASNDQKASDRLISNIAVFDKVKLLRLNRLALYNDEYIKWFTACPSVPAKIVSLTIKVDEGRAMEVLAKCTELKELDLKTKSLQECDGSIWKQVAPVLCTLTKLEKIYFHHVTVTDDTEDALFSSIPPSVKNLDFWNCKLVNFPAIQHLKELHSLTFHSVTITNMIPDWVSQMDKLQRFYIWTSESEKEMSVPMAELKLPKNTGYAYLSNCDVLPDDIFELCGKKMSFLSFIRSTIKQIPDQVLDHLSTKLSSLRFEHMEKLEDLANLNLAKLKRLKTISFVSLPNFTLPLQLSSLPLIGTVSIQKCKLQQIPPELLNIPSLTSLNLDYNDISSTPESILNHTAPCKLLHLSLQNNKFAEAPDLSNNPTLKTIKMKGNAAMEKAFVDMPNYLGKPMSELFQYFANFVYDQCNPMFIDASFKPHVIPVRGAITSVIQLHERYLFLLVMTCKKASTISSDESKYYDYDKGYFFLTKALHNNTFPIVNFKEEVIYSTEQQRSNDWAKYDFCK